MSTAPMYVDTTKVTNRRAVRYADFDALLADAEQLVTAEAAGRTRQLGNMTLGQELGHVALWMHSSMDGIPIDAPPIVRLVARMFKRMILTKGLRPGFKLPPDAVKKLVPPDSITSAEGFNQLSAACARLRREGTRVASPLLGKLTVDEWDELHLRHAELHLSFIEVVPV